MSHGNTARLAAEHGDPVLGKVCGAIAADESRHEVAYTRIVDEFFRWVLAGAGGAGGWVLVGAGESAGEGAGGWVGGWVCGGCSGALKGNTARPCAHVAPRRAALFVICSCLFVCVCRQDPNNAMLSFADMMRKQIVMPAHLMDDGKHGILNSGRNLFHDFSELAERSGGE